MLCLYISVLF